MKLTIKQFDGRTSKAFRPVHLEIEAFGIEEMEALQKALEMMNPNSSWCCEAGGSFMSLPPANMMKDEAEGMPYEEYMAKWYPDMETMTPDWAEKAVADHEKEMVGWNALTSQWDPEF